jgi:hypothetical protein
VQVNPNPTSRIRSSFMVTITPALTARSPVSL